MKFGGTSMGSAERIRIAAQLASEQYARRPLVIVVSAMSKVTDLLIDSLKKAEVGDQAGLDSNLEQLAARHVEACCGLLPEALHEEAISGVSMLLAELLKKLIG